MTFSTPLLQSYEILEPPLQKFHVHSTTPYSQIVINDLFYFSFFLCSLMVCGHRCSDKSVRGSTYMVRNMITSIYLHFVISADQYQTNIYHQATKYRHISIRGYYTLHILEWELFVLCSDNSQWGWTYLHPGLCTGWNDDLCKCARPLNNEILLFFSFIHFTRFDCYLLVPIL